MAARITFLLNRAVRAHFTTDHWKENMKRIDDCTRCGHCAAHCPYGIDTPVLLKQQQEGYFNMV
jgi:Fe-S oxidoreductase